MDRVGGGSRLASPSPQPSLSPVPRPRPTSTPHPTPPLPLPAPPQGLLQAEPEVFPPALLLLAPWGTGTRTGTGHHPAEREAVERKENVSGTLWLSKGLSRGSHAVSPGVTAVSKAEPLPPPPQSSQLVGTDPRQRIINVRLQTEGRWSSRPT